MKFIITNSSFGNSTSQSVMNNIVPCTVFSYVQKCTQLDTCSSLMKVGEHLQISEGQISDFSEVILEIQVQVTALMKLEDQH